MKSSILSALVIFLITGCATQRTSPRYTTIGGTISNENKTPAAGIQVLLFGNNSLVSTYTEGKGWYQFQKIKPSKSYALIPVHYGEGSVMDTSTVDGQAIIELAEQELGKTDGESPGRYNGYGAGWCS